MSFDKKEDSSSLISKRFVSENELEEIKKKREEEWEIARSQGRKIEKEEDVVYDGRTLYDRLKEQKDKKQEEFEESIKFKNMIYKGLNEEDAAFLSDVSKQQAEFHNKRFDDDSEELMSYRAAVESVKEKTVTALDTSKAVHTDARQASKDAPKNKLKPKPSLLAGVIVRKRSTNTETHGAKDSKHSKMENSGEESTNDGKVANTHDAENVKEKREDSKKTSLSGLIAYSDTDSSEDEP